MKLDCKLNVWKYPFDWSYYLKRDPYLRWDPAVMLWQRREQWNTKETKVARLSLRLKRDDNVVPSLWLELLTGDNPLKRPPLLFSLPAPSPCNATPQPPAALPPCSWPTGWAVTMPVNTTTANSSATWSTKDLRRRRNLSRIGTSPQKRLVLAGMGCCEGAPEGLFTDAVDHSYGLMSSFMVHDCFR